MPNPRLDLDWLGPQLDRCRRLIAEKRTTQRWTKSTSDGRTERVTTIDLNIERLLTDAIQRRLPGTAILSEESQPDPFALAQPTCVVIDPIDGTDELIAGRPGYAISVALLHNGQPVAAALDLPAYDRRFEGKIGEGVRLNGQAVTLSPIDNLGRARLAVSATQHRMNSLRPFWDSVAAAALVPTPAFTPKFAAVLAGDCDAALYLPVHPHPTAIWDYAAAGLLLREAGGWFGSTDGTDLYEQRPVTYSGGWVATPIRLRDELLAAAQRLQPPTDASARSETGLDAGG